MSDVTVTSSSPVGAPSRPDRRKTVGFVLLGIAALLGVGQAVAFLYIVVYCQQPLPGWDKAGPWILGLALALVGASMVLRRKRLT